jgi:RNA polymerase sigma factor (sigma-70 family)
MRAGTFNALSDDALARLSDDDLVAYICAARDAGESRAMRQGLRLLTWGNMSRIVARMRLRVPPEHAEEVAMEAFEKAAEGAFRGECVGEFRSWLTTIIHGTATDWLRRSYRRSGAEASLDDPDAGIEPSIASESGAIELRLVAEEVLGEMSDDHRRVIELHVFKGFTAPEVCERIDGMSVDNVAQIASRFRQRMRRALEDGT